MTMRRFTGPGKTGIGGLNLLRAGGALGAPPLDFDFDTFTASMAKRATGVFAASPIVQGHWDGTGTPDVLSFLRGAQVSGHWYANFDAYQGSVALFWTSCEARTGFRDH